MTNNDSKKMEQNDTKSRRSSFFSMGSFVRSNGDRGASVAALRGTHGADFEATAKVLRDGASGGCSCIFGGTKAEKFIMLKGPFCFVYNNERSTSPLYAINLVDMKATKNGYVALLQTTFGDNEYELRFEDDSKAESFCKKVAVLAKSGKCDEVRKQLGHEHLLNRTKSIMFAETIALKKVDDQPSVPITAIEVLGQTPVSVM